MKRVLVTGGTGFVGANLVHRLVERGEDVHLLVRPNYAAWRIADVQDHIVLHENELTDGDSLRALFQTIRPDWVFHLAAHGAYSWQTNLAEMLATNLQGTLNLVQAALATGVDCLVNTGSSSEYGFQDHAPAESELPEPNSDYAFTKVAATTYCRFIAQQKKARIYTLRLYSVYGPYEEPRRLIPQLLVNVRRGQLPPLAAPHIARDYIYASDVVDAYLALAGTTAIPPGTVYNVGTGVQTQLREAVDLARRMFGLDIQPRWGTLAPREWDTKVWVANIAKIQRELNWRPQVDLEEGLRQTAQWLDARADLAALYQPTSLP